MQEILAISIQDKAIIPGTNILLAASGFLEIAFNQFDPRKLTAKQIKLKVNNTILTKDVSVILEL